LSSKAEWVVLGKSRTTHFLSAKNAKGREEKPFEKLTSRFFAFFADKRF